MYDASTIHRAPEPEVKPGPRTQSTTEFRLAETMPKTTLERRAGWPLSGETLAAMTETFLLAAVRAAEAERAKLEVQAVRLVKRTAARVASAERVERAYRPSPKRAAGPAGDPNKSRVHPIVTVDGMSREFVKVRDAFAAYGLPDYKHKDVRVRLKQSATGRVEFGYKGKVYVFTTSAEQ